LEVSSYKWNIGENFSNNIAGTRQCTVTALSCHDYTGSLSQEEKSSLSAPPISEKQEESESICLPVIWRHCQQKCK